MQIQSNPSSTVKNNSQDFSAYKAVYGHHQGQQGGNNFKKTHSRGENEVQKFFFRENARSNTGCRNYFFFREINYHFPLGRSLGAWLPGWFHGYAGGMYCIIVYFLTNLKKSRQKTREIK